MTYTGNYPTASKLPAGFTWGGGGQPPWNATVSAQTTFAIKLKVDNGTTISTVAPYEFPFLVEAANGMTQTFKLYVYVEEADSKNDQYVEILGYAAVEILWYDTNDVYGQYVSQLEADYTDLTSGLRPRLIPWED
jgi:hypothetical protein